MPKGFISKNNFIRGNKTSYDPSSIPLGSIWKSRNVRMEESGILRIRGGAKRYGTFSKTGVIQGMTNAFDKILMVHNKNTYLIDGDTNTQIGTNQVGALSDSNVDFINWARNGAEIAYLFGGNGIYETSGSSVALTTPYSPASGEKANLILTKVTNPSTAPSLTTSTTGGSLAAATYYVIYTWVNSAGETMVSPESSITTSGSTSTITATLPTFPSGVTSANIYISTSTGTETKQGSTTTTTYTQSSDLVSGAAQPSENTAVMQDTTSGPAKCYYSQLRASLGQRLVVAGNPDYPNRVYFSAPLDASYFPSDQVLQLPDDDGYITGIKNWYNALLIFRNKDIWAFFGSSVTDSSARLVIQENSVGCISYRSIVDVNNVGIVFLGGDKVYTLTGVSGIENQAQAIGISNDIENFITDHLKVDNLQVTGIDNIHAAYFDQEYRLTIPHPTKKEIVFRFNTRNNDWYVDSGPKTKQFLNRNSDLYAYKLDEGVIFKFDENHLRDDQARIPFHVSFGRDALGRGTARVKRIFIEVMSKGKKNQSGLGFFAPVFNTQLFNTEVTAQVEIEVATDQNLDISLVVDGEVFYVKNVEVKANQANFIQLQQSEPVKRYEGRFRPSLKANNIQLRIDADEIDEDIAILAYHIEYSDSGRLKGIRYNVDTDRSY